MEADDGQRVLKCFYPVGGIAIGFVLGWVLHFLIPKPTGWAEAVDAAGRFFMLLFGLFGWAVGIVFDNRRLHCGGTKELDPSTRTRYRFGAVVGIALLVLASVFLATTRLGCYFFTVFLVICMLLGEIGWGSPLAALRIPFSRDRK